VARETVDRLIASIVFWPGLLESVYETVLAGELRKRGLRAATSNKYLSCTEGTRFEVGFRGDLVWKTRSSSKSSRLQRSRPHTETTLELPAPGGKRLGLLINFNVVLIKDGITRIVNG